MAKTLYWYEYWIKKKCKNKDFEKDFFELMNKSVFGKTMENARNHRDIRLVTTDKRRSILASEPNYHSSKLISKFDDNGDKKCRSKNE